MRDVLLERPMIDRTDLLWALDPRGELATARYRRLLRDGILTPGVIAHPRRAGRLAGSVHIFCALNREIIAAARADRTDLLDELRAETLRIECGPLREWADAVSDRLVIDDESDEHVELPVASGRTLRPQDSWLHTALRWQHDEADAEASAAVLAAADDAVQVRSMLGQRDLRSAQVTLSRVWRIGEKHAEIRPVEPSAQEAFSFFAEEVFSAGLRLGDPVAVRHEAGAPGVFITTLEPALDAARRSDPTLASPPPPAHLDALLDESRLSARSGDVPPLRRVA